MKVAVRVGHARQWRCDRSGEQGDELVGVHGEGRHFFAFLFSRRIAMTCAPAVATPTPAPTATAAVGDIPRPRAAWKPRANAPANHMAVVSAATFLALTCFFLPPEPTLKVPSLFPDTLTRWPVPAERVLPTALPVARGPARPL